VGSFEETYILNVVHNFVLPIYDLLGLEIELWSHLFCEKTQTWILKTQKNQHLHQ
jgi:hypothetical protein